MPKSARTKKAPTKPKVKVAARAAPKSRAKKPAAAVKRQPRPAVPSPPRPPEVSQAERSALVVRALEALEQQRWAGLPVTKATLGGAEVRLVSPPAPRPIWWLRTHGLFEAARLELSLRAPRTKEESQAPAWMAPVMERLIAFARQGRLSAGQVVRWELPFGAGAETDLEAFAIGIDPTFGTVTTPHDSVPVLLAVGIARDEARLVREWSSHALLELLGTVDPTLSTSLERGSLLASPRARQAIEQRVEREGSSMGVLDAQTSEVLGKEGKRLWRLDVESTDSLLSLLKGRIGHQRPVLVRAAGRPSVEVAPGDQPAFTVTDEGARLKLTQPVARALRATLRATPGTYTWPELPGLTLEVVP